PARLQTISIQRPYPVGGTSDSERFLVSPFDRVYGLAVTAPCERRPLATLNFPKTHGSIQRAAEDELCLAIPGQSGDFAGMRSERPGNPPGVEIKNANRTGLRWDSEKASIG